MLNVKTYSAEFCSIKQTNKYIKYYFKDIRDNSNAIIKQFMWVKFQDLNAIVDNLNFGDRILFDAAESCNHFGYYNNFKLIKPHNIRMYNND